MRKRRFRSMLRTPGRLLRASRRQAAREVAAGRPATTHSLEGAQMAVKMLHDAYTTCHKDPAHSNKRADIARSLRNHRS